MAAVVPAPFDVMALYQAAETVLPADPVKAQVLWACLAADLAAAGDEIRRLNELLEERNAQ